MKMLRDRALSKLHGVLIRRSCSSATASFLFSLGTTLPRRHALRPLITTQQVQQSQFPIPLVSFHKRWRRYLIPLILRAPSKPELRPACSARRARLEFWRLQKMEVSILLNYDSPVVKVCIATSFELDETALNDKLRVR